MDQAPPLPDTPATSRAMLASAFGAFLVMGVAGAMATTLVPLVPQLYGLGLSAAMTVQWIALVVAGASSLLLAHRLQRVGPRTVMLGGLALVAAGCGLVALAMNPHLPFAALVGALAVVALGIAALQVAANLCAVRAGPQRTAAARLAAAQACNSLGVLGGVSLGSALALGGGAQGAGLAYLAAGLITLAVLAGTVLVRADAWGAPDTAAQAAPIRQALRSRRAWLGALTIALYVGAEGTIGSLLIPYLHQPGTMNLNLASAGQLVAWLYWGGALLGRIAGSAVLARVRPAAVLAFTAVLAVACALAAATGNGSLPGWALLATGLFNAVMFPVIFALTLEQADAPQAAVSGLLSTAIVGGAALSVAAGLIAQHIGIAQAFAVPALAYGAIAGFAVWALRLSPAPPQDSRTTSSSGSRSDLIS